MGNQNVREAVEAAIVACALHPAYDPPPLAELGDLIWQSCAPTDEEGGSTDMHAVRRDWYHELGTSALDRCLFLLMMDDLVGKPTGYATIIKNVIVSNKILRVVLAAIHPRYLQHNPAKVDGGFKEFFGAYSVQEQQDMDVMVRRFRRVFKPLLEAGGAAYMTCSGNTNKKKTVKSTGSKKRYAADVQFLLSARAVQELNTAAFQSPDGESSSASRSSIDPSGESLRVLSWEPNQDEVSASPLSFGPRGEVADHAAILTADFHVLMKQRPPWSPSPPRPTPPPAARLRKGRPSGILLSSGDHTQPRPVSPDEFELSFVVNTADERFFLMSSTAGSSPPHSPSPCVSAPGINAKGDVGFLDAPSAPGPSVKAPTGVGIPTDLGPPFTPQSKATSKDKGKGRAGDHSLNVDVLMVSPGRSPSRGGACPSCGHQRPRRPLTSLNGQDTALGVGRSAGE
ncbi:hypothetical protein B0H15DRAFT_871849 [Mycena belliarum]|uniref:Uncharacterized protein n=1 Tax=Mycena belliarum TaxID=1033014 RepID=A0AAD6TNI4_9AGAR|nr:hypothetical protein B0H15DRAFT_871849 [Mycena belliae]